MGALEFLLETPDKGRAIAFPGKSFVIGSDPTCEVPFASELMAARHAEVACDTRGQWWIRDLMANGLVAVNNRPVLDERLTPGDTVRVADVVMVVHDTGVDVSGRTRSGDSLPAVADANELPPDTVVDGRYRVVKRLATGGMGEVYQGVHVELGKSLALKVMLPELSSDDDFVARFKREAVATSRIGQQNIVDISDFGRTADGRFYFVMEFLDGRTLLRQLRKDGPFPVARAVHVGLQVARALAAAHQLGVVHRDLKPENVMLLQRPGQPDFVKVLDFGIAKVTGSTGKTGGFTAIGTVVGTPQYMAPEQAAGLPVDARSDIYSLGLILHELVRGEPTFQRDGPVELMAAQISATPPKLSSPLGPVPAPLERLVSQLLEKQPRDRPASMEAVLAALEAVASVPTPVARVKPLDPKEATALVAAHEAFGAAARTVTDEAPVTGSMPGASPPTQAVTPAPLPAPPTVAGQPAPAAATAIAPGAVVTSADAEPLAGPGLKSRTPLVIAGLVVAILVLGAAFVALGPSEPAPPPVPVVVVQPVAPTPAPVPPAPVAPARVALTVTSEPGGAEVLEDDVLLGTTPLTLQRPPGTVAALVVALKGHKREARKVRFEADTTVNFPLEKEKAKAGGKRPALADDPYGNDGLKDLPE